MIVYTDEAIITPFTDHELNEQITRMLAFCRINGDSKQVSALADSLVKLEESIAKGKFEN